MPTLPAEGYFGLSATTGSYGDAHVMYALQPASLDGLKAEEALHQSQHVALPGETPISTEHQVHAESHDHHTEVPVAITETPPAHGSSSSDAAAGGAPVEGGGEEMGPTHTPVHMPPAANEDEKMDHLLRTLEAHHEIRAALDEVCLSPLTFHS